MNLRVVSKAQSSRMANSILDEVCWLAGDGSDELGRGTWVGRFALCYELSLIVHPLQAAASSQAEWGLSSLPLEAGEGAREVPRLGPTCIQVAARRVNQSGLPQTPL